MKGYLPGFSKWRISWQKSMGTTHAPTHICCERLSFFCQLFLSGNRQVDLSPSIALIIPQIILYVKYPRVIPAWQAGQLEF